jgi:prophage regulatory protein
MPYDASWCRLLDKETNMSTDMTRPRRTLRIRPVSEKTGLAPSSIWRLASQGQFPAPFKLSPGCTAWFEHEIDEWLYAKSLKRDATPQCAQN